MKKTATALFVASLSLAGGVVVAEPTNEPSATPANEPVADSDSDKTDASPATPEQPGSAAVPMWGGRVGPFTHSAGCAGTDQYEAHARFHCRRYEGGKRLSSWHFNYCGGTAGVWSITWYCDY